MAKAEVYVRPENQPKEQQAERFKIAASGRVSKALATMESIERLANPVGYKWTPGQARKITEALHAAADRVGDAFANPEAPSEAPTFSL